MDCKSVIVLALVLTVFCGISSSLPADLPANVTLPPQLPLIFLPDDVKYYIFNNENPNAQLVLQSEAQNITTVSSFNTSKDTVFLIHGWNSQFNGTFCVINTNQYLASYNVNIVTVYWDRISSQDYVSARLSVPYVGRTVGQFISVISSIFAYALARFHIVGHSLGAHISGFAGQYNNGLFGRITGLDPAGPGFLEPLPVQRLSEDDATFVDVIHTNAGKLGANFSCGHADFYPNGGETQPGCDALDLPCSHSRAYYLYNESLTTDLFIAKTCGSYSSYINEDCRSNPPVIMGQAYTDMTKRGTFYLNTSDAYPYALGDTGL